MARILHVVTPNYEYVGRYVKPEKEHYLGKNWIRLDKPCRVHVFEEKGEMKLSMATTDAEGVYLPYVDINTVTAREILPVNDKGSLYKLYVKETTGLHLANSMN